MTNRDDFSAATKRTLAIRAAYFCSNPDCLKLTAGPHSDPSKSLTTGHAAHIHAAAPGGARYDKTQTPKQRKAIENGLWLCRECGDIVDKDDSKHSPSLLKDWKSNHEVMITEIRTKGYARSLELLSSGRLEPTLAKRIISLLEDRRVFWEMFDAEFPDRVRQSLGYLRSQLAEMRGTLTDGTPIDNILLSLTKTIHMFFRQVEKSDLAKLRCNSADPEWMHFRNALSSLRKAVGIQIGNLAKVYGIRLSPDLQKLVPMQT